jgi:hypothetical protein
VRQGPGTLVDVDGHWRMEGFWENNQAFRGIGVKEFTDGQVYRGYFKNGKYHGTVRTF